MSVPIELRGDFSAGDVRAVARRCKDGAQVRRLLAIATILDGHSRSDAALVGVRSCGIGSFASTLRGPTG